MELTNDGNRTIDSNGFLYAPGSVITGEDVAPYLGREIPKYRSLGLEPERVYQVYRPKDEIKDADFSHKPFLLGHQGFDADTCQTKTKFILGTIGDSKMKGSEIQATPVFWNKVGIDHLKKGKRSLSCGYAFDPVMESGSFNGKPYDLKMTNIRANHVALVDTPRYKPAMVADENSIMKKGKLMFNPFKKAKTELTLDEAFEEAVLILANDEMTGEDKAEELKKVKDKLPKKMEEKKDCDDKKKAEDKKKAKDADMPDVDAMDSKMIKDSLETLEASFDKKLKDGIEAGIQTALSHFKTQNVAMDSALREYERVCGKPNRMAFDSADAIYSTILKNSNKSFEAKSTEQKAAMVEMLPGLHRAKTEFKVTGDSATPKTSKVPKDLAEFLNERN